MTFPDRSTLANDHQRVVSSALVPVRHLLQEFRWPDQEYQNVYV
jgi:hypothetical protein